MDFNLKQWRDEQQQKQQHESEENQDQTQTPSAKLPRLLTLDPFLNSPPPAAPAPASSSAPLPLFLTEPTTTKNDMSPSPSDSSPTKLPRYGSYFSTTQWQELELQALIFRHMLAGAAIPPQLLNLIHKSINPYYFTHSLHQHFSHFHPSLMQSSGYWGKGGMDPEPTRCRRTDGKKWRCSKDVVAGHKYCERHVHRGRNRSRKPVEIPTPPPTSGVGGGLLKVTAPSVAAHQPIASGSITHVGASPLFDIRHLNNRSSTFETQDGLSGVGNSSSSQTLRHFFDDWSRPHQESENAVRSAGSIATTSSISVSDFSLKLATGGDGNASGSMQQDRSQPNPDGHTWASHQMAPMGGPLAEALRSSTSNSSPTSVLHH